VLRPIVGRSMWMGLFAMLGIHRRIVMDRKGFTLMELLVVIAVIALLLSMLGPGVMGLKDVAKRTQCGKDMAELGTAYLGYAADNKMKLMSSNTRWDSGGNSTEINKCWVGSGNTENSIKYGQMYPYVESMKPYRCTNPINDEYLRSYSINGQLNGERIVTDKLTGVVDPGGTLLMIEEDDWRGYNVNSWFLNSINTWVDYVSGNHNEGDNLVFVDGSMQYWQWEDPDTLTLPYSEGGFGRSDNGSEDLKRLWPVFNVRK